VNTPYQSKINDDKNRKIFNLAIDITTFTNQNLVSIDTRQCNGSKTNQKEYLKSSYYKIV